MVGSNDWVVGVADGDLRGALKRLRVREGMSVGSMRRDQYGHIPYGVEEP